MLASIGFSNLLLCGSAWQSHFVIDGTRLCWLQKQGRTCAFRRTIFKLNYLVAMIFHQANLKIVMITFGMFILGNSCFIKRASQDRGLDKLTSADMAVLTLYLLDGLVADQSLRSFPHPPSGGTTGRQGSEQTSHQPGKIPGSICTPDGSD